MTDAKQRRLSLLYRPIPYLSYLNLTYHTSPYFILSYPIQARLLPFTSLSSLTRHVMYSILLYYLTTFMTIYKRTIQLTETFNLQKLFFSSYLVLFKCIQLTGVFEDSTQRFYYTLLRAVTCDVSSFDVMRVASVTPLRANCRPAFILINAKEGAPRHSA